MSDTKMKIDLRKTERGFKRADFVDLYGMACSIQESSLAEDDAIWLGVHDERVSIMTADGWQPYHMPKDTQLPGRMHLNREQVAALLPLLQRFVKRGRL